MSRYVIWTSDANLEVFVGFDEGVEGFFLTIADSRTCTGEPGSYLFHNLDHHSTPQMTLEEVTAILARFGLTLPPELVQQLVSDANCPCAMSNEITAQPVLVQTVRVLSWQRAD